MLQRLSVCRVVQGRIASRRGAVRCGLPVVWPPLTLLDLVPSRQSTWMRRRGRGRWCWRVHVTRVQRPAKTMDGFFSHLRGGRGGAGVGLSVFSAERACSAEGRATKDGMMEQAGGQGGTGGLTEGKGTGSKFRRRHNPQRAVAVLQIITVCSKQEYALTHTHTLSLFKTKAVYSLSRFWSVYLRRCHLVTNVLLARPVISWPWTLEVGRARPSQVREPGLPKLHIYRWLMRCLGFVGSCLSSWEPPSQSLSGAISRRHEYRCWLAQP